MTEKDTTFVALLKACAKKKDIDNGTRLHTDILKRELLKNNPYLATSLINMYAKCGVLEKAQQVLEDLPIRNVISWSALISGYVQHGQGCKALICFERMRSEGHSPDAITFMCILQACGSTGAVHKGQEIHEEIANMGFLAKHIMLGTALVDMYVKCGLLAKAKQVLEELPFRNVVTWNVIITGYAQQDQGHAALNCFEQMRNEGVSPNAVTFICVLKACGSSGDIDIGQEVHAHVCIEGFDGNIELGNALVCMYAKCGSLSEAWRIFNQLHVRDIVSWSALIAGHADKGESKNALDLFERMKDEKIKPDHVVFLSVLKACSHAGLIDEGQWVFNDMCNAHSQIPSVEHYTCMVDLFGRAGCFDKAMAIIEKMPLYDYRPTWSALLNACHQWGNVRLGRLAFKHAVQIDSGHIAAYVCMSNIYAACGIRDGIEMIG